MAATAPLSNKIAFSIVGLLIWSLSIIGLFFLVEQSSFGSIAIFYIGAFTSYVVLWRNLELKDFNLLFYAAIIIRIIGIFAFPGLSDDLYRFIWDGRLALEGWHPFEHLPSYFLEEGNEVNGITKTLYNQLNSPNYYTIYPTISQWIFTVSAWVFPESIYGFSCVMKAILVAMEIGSLFIIRLLLDHMNMNRNRALLYGLNPLVIVEISGNGHFEGAMIFFILLCTLMFVRQYYFWSALALAAGVASKMLPLMFLPLLLAILPWKKAFRFYLYVVLGLLVCFAPMLSTTLLNHLGDSLNLYFQKFEFNASIYYVVRWIGFQTTGWNIIEIAGPRLALVVFASIWLLTLFNWKYRKAEFGKGRNWLRMMMWSLTIYLLFATIVHPWYITTLVALSIFTNYKFPILWSGLIVLTYINYSYDPYWENLWIVGIEYLLIIGMLFFEIKRNNFNLKSPSEYSGDTA